MAVSETNLRQVNIHLGEYPVNTHQVNTQLLTFLK